MQRFFNGELVASEEAPDRSHSNLQLLLARKARADLLERQVGFRGDKIEHRPPFDRMPYEYRLPFAAVDGLIALANVDYKAVGLESFGKPGNFLTRQVDRWAGQLASYQKLYNYQGRELPGYELTAEWLRAHTPLVYAGLYDDGLVDEQRRRAELARDARDRRAAPNLETRLIA